MRCWTMKWYATFLITRDVSCYEVSSLCNLRCQRHTGPARWESKAPVSSSDVSWCIVLWQHMMMYDVSLCIWMYLVHFPWEICRVLESQNIGFVSASTDIAIRIWELLSLKGLETIRDSCNVLSITSSWMNRCIDPACCSPANLAPRSNSCSNNNPPVSNVESRHNKTLWNRHHSNIQLMREKHGKTILNCWVALQKHWLSPIFTDFHLRQQNHEPFLFTTKRWSLRRGQHSLHRTRVARGADPAAVHALIRHGHWVHLRAIQTSDGHQIIQISLHISLNSPRNLPSFVCHFMKLVPM